MTGKSYETKLTDILQQIQISKVSEQLRKACELIEAN